MITLRTIRDIVDARVRPLMARLNNVASRGVLSTVDDAQGLTRGQTTLGADQVADDIEFASPYGLSSNPAAGAESVVWAVGATAGHLLGMIFDRRIRLKGTLAAGEVALHIGVAGQLVHLKADGEVVIQAGTDGGTVTVKPNGDIVVLPAATGSVYLGDGAATKKLALGPDVQARLDALQTAINGWVPVAMDGGLALKTALTAWLLGSNIVDSTNVYGKG